MALYCESMKHKESNLLFILFVIVFFFSNAFPQLQTKPLPVVVTCRKSFLGGSYVLQIEDTSSSPLNIWLEAREKFATYLIPDGKMKEIGWVQGFRFDANDVFFMGAEGYDTLKSAMPSAELSPIRIGFSEDGALTINLSQSFLQEQLSKYLQLPIKQKYPNLLEIEINEIPQIILRDRSERIYANVVLQAIIFSAKIHVPINVTVSFVSSYVPSTGIIVASQINADNINISDLPNEWFNEVTMIINKLIPIWFSKVQIFQLDNTTLKYCKFLNVHQISVHNGRLEIKLL